MRWSRRASSACPSSSTFQARSTWDFADVRTVMGIPGSALMAIGRGNGKLGVVDAARQAMANPLLNMSIKGAQGVLFSVKGGSNLSLGGVNAAGELISSTVRKNATVFFGMSIDDELDEGRQADAHCHGPEGQQAAEQPLIRLQAQRAWLDCLGSTADGWPGFRRKPEVNGRLRSKAGRPFRVQPALTHSCDLL